MIMLIIIVTIIVIIIIVMIMIIVIIIGYQHVQYIKCQFWMLKGHNKCENQ